MCYKKPLSNGLFKCRKCGYIFKNFSDFSFDEDEKVPCCLECGELIEDGDE